MTGAILPQPRSSKIVWAMSIAVAALGTWLMYLARPGINWGIWTTAAAAGLLLFPRKADRSALPLICLTAVAIGFGAAITTDPFMTALICLGVIVFLALEMLMSTEPRLTRLTASFTIPAPIVAFAFALVESAKRVAHAFHVIRSHRIRSTLQGLAITLPVILVFGLLLAAADPMFARLRDTVEDFIATWDFLPRTIFFLALLTIVLGAYGYAERSEQRTAPGASFSFTSTRWLGSTQRLILLSGVAALFWIFLAVQLSYFFGNLPQVSGSGVTFADYARSGFGELTVVASASIVLVLFADRFGEVDDRAGLIRAVTLSLIVAVLFLLGSAFNRVLLYEDAYGFTTSRMYAQAYMIIVGFVLLALGLEISGELQTSRLFRRSFAAATIVFLGLVYWNHEAWIANHNIDRFAASGKLDASYLTRDLSLNAVPAIVERIGTLPEPARTELSNALRARYAGRRRLLDGRWFEWNLRRSAARDALIRLRVPLDSAIRRAD